MLKDIYAVPDSASLGSSSERINILGVGLSAINMTQALEQMVAWIEMRQMAYIVVAPVYTLMVSQFNAVYREIVNRANMVTPDGMPLVFLTRWMGHPNVRRVYGPDLMLAFSSLAATQGYTSFYYGGHAGVPDQLAEVLTHRFAGLKVVGTYSPPFRPLDQDEKKQVIDMINAANPDVVWVGLGSPKQDFWVAEYRKELTAPILIGVGAAFDFLIGRRPQAPGWMQRYALEWLFRLYHEPRRLWRRYLIYNPLFVIFMLMQAVGLRRIPLPEEINTPLGD
jgi:N-acetylglucosaminyldiphosphoundecaprenol N-acetyl-beta-D-mannosaminyltransferase